MLIDLAFFAAFTLFAGYCTYRRMYGVAVMAALMAQLFMLVFIFKG